MTRKQFHTKYCEETGDGHHNGQCWKEFRQSIQTNKIDWAHIRFWKAVKMQQKDVEDDMQNITATEIRNRENSLGCVSNTFSLAPLQSATVSGPYHDYDLFTDLLYTKQEGINPMYPAKTMAYATSVPSGDLTINLAPAASASVSSKSDTAIQRDYLMSRLETIDNSFRYGKFYSQMRGAFNLDINNRPQTSQALVDAIKGGKFKMDDRILKLQAAGEEYDEATDSYIGGLFDAFIWDGPMPDKAGFDLAREAIKTQLQTAKDTIIVKSPDDGLAAIQALEAWTPTGKAN